MKKSSIQTYIFFARLSLVASWSYGAYFLVSWLQLSEWIENPIFFIIFGSALYLFIKLGEIEDLAINTQASAQAEAIWQTRYTELAKYCAELESKQK